MVNNAREAFQTGANQYDLRPFTPELCEVIEVYHHTDYYPSSVDFDVVDLKVRDVRLKPNSSEDWCIYHRALVMQRPFGRMQGSPWTPKIGDLVIVIFLRDNQPIVLGSICNIYQEPVIRSTSTSTVYDIVHKICQYAGTPPQDDEGDFHDHPVPANPPVCFKYFDASRDCMAVHECTHGYAENDPGCKECTSIDHIDSECTRVKVRSSDDSESSEPKYRVRFDHHCGTKAVVDEDGNVRIENMVEEVPKGHITMNPKGTITAESTPEESDDGSLVKAYAPDDGDISCEMKDKLTGACVRIYKSGDIEVSAVNAVEIKSASSITCNTSTVNVTGDMQIAGFCSHNGCSCGGSGGSSGVSGSAIGTGESQAISTGLVDTAGDPLTPGNVKLSAGASLDGVDGKNIYATAPAGEEFTWEYSGFEDGWNTESDIWGNKSIGYGDTTRGIFQYTGGVCAIPHNTKDTLGTACAPTDVVLTPALGGESNIVNMDSEYIYITGSTGTKGSFECAPPDDGWGGGQFGT